MPQSFNSSGRSITDPTDIANEFCKYFTNIGPNLANRIPTVNSTYNSFLTDRVRESIFLKPTNIAELTEICQSLKSGKASGCDDMSMQVIKNTFEIISQPLVQIINLSLLNGYFPNKLKLLK